MQKANIHFPTDWVLLRDGEGSAIYALQAGRFAPPQIAGTPLAGGAGQWEQGGRHYIGREGIEN